MSISHGAMVDKRCILPVLAMPIGRAANRCCEGGCDHKSFHFIPYNPNHSASYPGTHIITVSLLPGIHYIKFVVDGNWRLAQDLPTAVDDDGSLTNYVTVKPPPTPSTLIISIG